MGPSQTINVRKKQSNTLLRQYFRLRMRFGISFHNKGGREWETFLETGEYIAQSKYNLKKAPSGSDGYDAVTAEGLKVQIKANHSASTIGFRGEADLLLVLKIESSAEWRELYYGPFKPVKENASYSKRDNKHMIPIAKLQELGKLKT